MPRIHPVNPGSATENQSNLLNAVQSKMGRVPNIIGAMAQSPAVANAYIGMSGALAEGTLPADLREQIALAVGEENSCGYCVAAHTAIGKGAGLSSDDAIAAREGRATDAKAEVGLVFVKKLVQDRGWVSDDDFERVRDAGYTDGEIGELVANTALNLFTNYFNHVAETEIDFPVPPALTEQSAV